MTLRLCVMFGVTLQIFLHLFPSRNNSLAVLEAKYLIFFNNFGLCFERFEATGGSVVVEESMRLKYGGGGPFCLINTLGFL